MVKSYETTEAEEKIREFQTWCEQNGFPILIATLQDIPGVPEKEYVYGYSPPSVLGYDIEKETGKPNKFALCLKILLTQRTD